VDGSLLIGGKTFSWDQAKTHATTLQGGSHPEDYIRGRRVVHSDLQTQGTATEQQIGVSYTKTGCNTADGIHIDYQSPTHDSYQCLGPACQSPTNGTPVAKGVSPWGSKDGNPPSITPTPHPLLKMS
jgi:hypothetical protein